MRRIFATIIVVGAVIPAVALANPTPNGGSPAPKAKVAPAVHQDPILKKQYTNSYIATHKICGKCSGRNIRKNGVPFTWVSKDGKKKHAATRPATNKELAKSKRQLDKLRIPGLVPTTPRQEPSGVMSAATPAPSGLAACIIRAESGGNTQAVNGQYHGIAQWSPTIWARDGGLKYASDPLGATYAQQLQVLETGLRNHGGGDWQPYDGC